MRDGGHNGGFATNNQLSCAGAIAGMDADFIIGSTPYVHPNQGEMAWEDFIRRSLISGAIPQSHEPRGKLLEKYGKFGFTSGHKINQPPSFYGVVSYMRHVVVNA